VVVAALVPAPALPVGAGSADPRAGGVGNAVVGAVACIGTAAVGSVACAA